MQPAEQHLSSSCLSSALIHSRSVSRWEGPEKTCELFSDYCDRDPFLVPLFSVSLPTEGCKKLCRYVQWHHHSVLTRFVSEVSLLEELKGLLFIAVDLNTVYLLPSGI